MRYEDLKNKNKNKKIKVKCDGMGSVSIIEDIGRFVYNGLVNYSNYLDYCLERLKIYGGKKEKEKKNNKCSKCSMRSH